MSQAVDPVGALACPATHLPLHPAPEAVIERLNTQVARRSLRDASGSLVTGAIDAGLLREDGAVLYPVRAGVAVLLIEAGIVLTAAERDG
jgi:uncharacterized protein YbaR (Trm112 family)